MMSAMQHELKRQEFDASILGFPATLIERVDGGPMFPITDGLRETTPVRQYDSIKNGCAVSWRSRRELHGHYHSEVSPSVLKYRARPHTLQSVIDGVARFCTPDREKEMVDGQHRIVEVRDEYEAEDDPDHAAEINCARAVYSLCGKLFRIQDRAEIEAQPLFDAVEAIQSFRHTAITPRDIVLVQEVFGGRAILPLAEVRDAFGNAPLGFAKLSAMMVRRIVAFDLSEALGPTTPIRLLGSG